MKVFPVLADCTHPESRLCMWVDLKVPTPEINCNETLLYHENRGSRWEDRGEVRVHPLVDFQMTARKGMHPENGTWVPSAFYEFDFS